MSAESGWNAWDPWKISQFYYIKLTIQSWSSQICARLVQYKYIYTHLWIFFWKIEDKSLISRYKRLILAKKQKYLLRPLNPLCTVKLIFFFSNSNLRCIHTVFHCFMNLLSEILIRWIALFINCMQIMFEMK